MHDEDEGLWRAIEAQDPRFDGWFVVGVTSTGIYCRPSCPARTPRRANMRLLPTAAAAQAEGFRACKRCRPDASPGSPEWDTRADLVGRAMRLIADGVVDRHGVDGLAAQLGYSRRQVHRTLDAAVGAGPLALARAHRAQTARVLLETTDLPMIELASAAGFGSVRQFNAAVQEVFALTPSQLRARRRPSAVGSAALTLQLPFRAPLDGNGLLTFLSARAIPGVEEVSDGAYRRSLRLPHGPGVVELRPHDETVVARFWLASLRDVTPAVARCRALLDLDGDPAAVLDALGEDPVIGTLVRARPGRRVAGHVDGDELAVRAVLMRQVSVAGPAALAARLVDHCGETLERPVGAVHRLFPTADTVADIDPVALGVPRTRADTLVRLATALASGEVVLDPGTDREAARAALRHVPGIGPWTTEYIAMRALRDPDAFPPGDAGVRQALRRLGMPNGPTDADRLAEAWRPYRASAVVHVWSSPAAH